MFHLVRLFALLIRHTHLCVMDMLDMLIANHKLFFVRFTQVFTKMTFKSCLACRDTINVK